MRNEIHKLLLIPWILRGNKLDIERTLNHIMKIIERRDNEIFEMLDNRLWVHIDEFDGAKIKLDEKTVTHSEEFGRGWNANSDDLADFLEEIKKKLEETRA